MLRSSANDGCRRHPLWRRGNSECNHGLKALALATLLSGVSLSSWVSAQPATTPTSPATTPTSPATTPTAPASTVQPPAESAPVAPTAETATPANEPAPVAASTTAPVPAETQCFPTCRPGYLCANGGVCVQACNPPCPRGTQCSPDLMCTPTTPQPAASEDDRDDDEHHRGHDKPTKEELAEQERIRSEARHRFRFQLGMRFSIIDVFATDKEGAEFGIMPGLRVNFSDAFGVAVAADAYVGEFDSNSTEGSTAGLRAQLSPYVGPFQHFTMGPTLVYGVSSNVEEDESGASMAKDEYSLYKFGLGFRVATVRGAQEQIEVAMQLIRFSESKDSGIGALRSNEFMISGGYAF